MCGYFACGAKTIVYNGSPMYPDAKHLLAMAAHYKVTYFGTSPRYLLEVEMSKTIPKHAFDLSAMRIVYTTGATLSPEQYRWFYSSFPSAVHLCNTAGGTDTATSLIAADPTLPIYAGEMQIIALGMDVDVVAESGESIMHTGEAGEMILRKPFPSMPCFFWGDQGGKIYRESYFERFTNIDVWAQHDWLARNPRTSGLVMSGRSDGVLSTVFSFSLNLSFFSPILTSGTYLSSLADSSPRPIRHPFWLRRNLRHCRSRAPQQLDLQLAVCGAAPVPRQ